MVVDRQEACLGLQRDTLGLCVCTLKDEYNCAGQNAEKIHQDVAG